MLLLLKSALVCLLYASTVFFTLKPTQMKNNTAPPWKIFAVKKYHVWQKLEPDSFSDLWLSKIICQIQMNAKMPRHI